MILLGPYHAASRPKNCLRGVSAGLSDDRIAETCVSKQRGYRIGRLKRGIRHFAHGLYMSPVDSDVCGCAQSPGNGTSCRIDKINPYFRISMRDAGTDWQRNIEIHVRRSTRGKRYSYKAILSRISLYIGFVLSERAGPALHGHIFGGHVSWSQDHQFSCAGRDVGQRDLEQTAKVTERQRLSFDDFGNHRSLGITLAPGITAFQPQGKSGCLNPAVRFCKGWIYGKSSITIYDSSGRSFSLGKSGRCGCVFSRIAHVQSLSP